MIFDRVLEVFSNNVVRKELRWLGGIGQRL